MGVGERVATDAPGVRATKRRVLAATGCTIGRAFTFSLACSASMLLCPALLDVSAVFGERDLARSRRRLRSVFEFRVLTTHSPLPRDPTPRHAL